MANERKVYDRVYEKKLQNSRFKFNPDKPSNDKFYNQGFSGSTGRIKPNNRGTLAEFEYSRADQESRLNRRSDAFDEWMSDNDRAAKNNLQQEPQDIIGSVSSSWLTSLGYNMAASEAVVTFRDSNAEFYYKISYETFLDWYSSPSKGKWLHDHPTIMHSYSMRRGQGSKPMRSQITKWHKKNNLKNRGDKKALAKKLAWLDKYR